MGLSFRLILSGNTQPPEFQRAEQVLLEKRVNQSKLLLGGGGRNKLI